MPAATLARWILIEARRGGLPWLALGSVLAAIALAAFLSQVAITESLELRASIVAALLRVCAVFLIAAHVSYSTLREMQDKVLELSLSFPLSRSRQYLGRLLGFAACGAALAAAFSLPLLLWTPPAAVALWGLSLACELALVASATLFFSMSLVQVVPAMAAAIGFYVLARSVAAIQAIAAGSLTEATFAAQFAGKVVDTIAFLLPRLDAATRTEWLIYGAPTAGAYLSVLGALALYALLLIAAGLFDFHRRSF